MNDRRKTKLLPIGIGIALVLIFSLFIYLNPQPFGKFINFLENGAYDLELKNSYKPVSKTLPILIVDIDDESILKEGRWPWPRKKLSDLVTTLYQMGARVIAFDITFPEAEINIAEEVSEALSKGGSSRVDEGIKESFNYDALFANSLKLGNSILGFVFKESGTPTGLLPSPLLTLTSAQTEQLSIPNMESYLGNIEILQRAAPFGAFINGTPDSDGILRFSPLLLRRADQVYSSIGLQAALIYMQNKKIELEVQNYGNSAVLEGIKLDALTIPTDPWGRILIPFRGPPYSIPNVSASDILQGKVPAATVANKLIFIGSSATALGDLVATAIAPVYAGVEVHADIASGILENYLPSKPTWGKGVTLALILLFGLSFAALLPFLEPIGAALLTLVTPTALIIINRWIWIHEGIALSVILPILVLLILYLFNMIWGYVFEKRRKEEIISIFGEYVPPDFIRLMLEKGGSFGLEGETKELTVLFADIRNFTTIAESMTASDLKKILNEYLTPMTQVIFDHKGTIDKYVGDMIMAFWGAPLEDPQNAFDAVSAGLDMQKALIAINEQFRKDQHPEIRIGVGINTGVMNVGDMGSKFRRAYTVIGDAVNLASRLEGTCKYYHAKVIVGEETYKHTAKSFGYRKLDRVKVKGKEKPIDIYEPLCFTEQCSPELISILETHNQAIESYFLQKWDASEALFQKLLSSDPAGKDLYQIYLNRIAHLRKTPPGPNWDCVFVFDTK